MAELDDVAEHAEAAAVDQRQVARRVRVMKRRRAAGWSWAKILEREPVPSVFELGRRSVKRAADALRTLAKVVAGGLAAEGQSRRQIGRWLGVTHQRVSALLRSGRRPITDGS